MNEPIARVKIWGDLACFTRPEMKVERASYDVPTPSAARGILDSILWKPEMRWIVRRILVLKPIRFVSFRRNELQSKIAPRTVSKWMDDPETFEPQPAGAGSEDATPRNTLALRDVAYVIEAEPHVFEPNGEDTPAKYLAMFNRRVKKGQCFQRPYLGCREFVCDFEPPGPDERPIGETRDLGLMLYDIVFRENGKGNRPLFFHAHLEDGVLNTAPDAVIEDAAERQEVLACSFKR